MKLIAFFGGGGGVIATKLEVLHHSLPELSSFSPPYSLPNSVMGLLTSYVDESNCIFVIATEDFHQLGFNLNIFSNKFKEDLEVGWI
jgi:hypothetical protein